MVITVTAFIFHKDKVLLIFHKKLNKWMHVGGHLKNNEFFDEGLKREMKEEVNLDVSILSYDKKLDKNATFLSKPFFIHSTVNKGEKDIAIDYICLAKEPINIKIKKDEIADFKWFSMEEIKNLDTFPLLKKFYP